MDARADQLAAEIAIEDALDRIGEKSGEPHALRAFFTTFRYSSGRSSGRSPRPIAPAALERNEADAAFAAQQVRIEEPRRLDLRDRVRVPGRREALLATIGKPQHVDGPAHGVDEKAMLDVGGDRAPLRGELALFAYTGSC